MQSSSKYRWQLAKTRQHLEVIRQNLDKADGEIGLMLGVSRQEVHSLRQRYGIIKVDARTQRKQRLVEQMRRLKPGLSAQDAAVQLGILESKARRYGRMTGYQFTRLPTARNSYWQKRIESLPPLLTISAVAQELGVPYGQAAMICYRHKYKVTIPDCWQRHRRSRRAAVK